MPFRIRIKSKGLDGHRTVREYWVPNWAGVLAIAVWILAIGTIWAVVELLSPPEAEILPLVRCVLPAFLLIGPAIILFNMAIGREGP